MVFTSSIYRCTTWTLTKRLEKKLDGNYTRMLRAILNKSSRQHPTKHQLYGHLPPITKTIQVRQTRHAEHCWRSRDEFISDVLLWTPANGREKAGRPARTYSISVRIRDVALKTCQKRWTIGRSGERGSGISVLATWLDDDDSQKLVIFHFPQVSWFFSYLIALLLPSFSFSTFHYKHGTFFNTKILFLYLSCIFLINISPALFHFFLAVWCRPCT